MKSESTGLHFSRLRHALNQIEPNFPGGRPALLPRVGHAAGEDAGAMAACKAVTQPSQTGRGGGAPLFFNTENRIFSRACSFARKYAKIRKSWFSGTSLRSTAAWTPKSSIFDAIWHKSGLFFHRKVAFERYFHPLDRPIDGMETEIDGMDRPFRRMDGRKIRWKASGGVCPL